MPKRKHDDGDVPVPSSEAASCSIRSLMMIALYLSGVLAVRLLPQYTLGARASRCFML